MPVLNVPMPVAAPVFADVYADAAAPRTHGARLRLPKRVFFTPDALQKEYG